MYIYIYIYIYNTSNKTKGKKSSDDSIMKNKPAFNPLKNRAEILDQGIDSPNSLTFPDLQRAPNHNLSELSIGRF